MLVNNPDAVPEPGAVASLAEFMDGHARVGSPARGCVNPDGSWQPSRRRFPTVGGTLVRRTPLRRAFPPLERQRAHYKLDERPTEPVEADWMLGGSLLLRRAMLERARRLRRRLPDVRRGDRPLLPRGEGGLGALVRPAGGRPPPLGRAHGPSAFCTRRTLWHWRSMLRYVRKHPEALFSR